MGFVQDFFLGIVSQRRASIVGLFSLFFFVFSFSSVHAASSTFVTKTLIGDDTTAPSIPTPFTATPVAMTQINLAWGTSTDDFILSGYHVYRDDVRIATTTATSYADTGLTASTTYTYYVIAFDSFFNTSASSSVVSTTTYATPTVPIVTEEEDGPVTGTRIPKVDLLSLSIIPGTHSAIIRYITDEYMRGVVRWGRTISYELGSSAERVFVKSHEVVIDGLSPDTVYDFIIEGEDNRGRPVSLRSGEFRTLKDVDTLPPGVVTDLTLRLEGNDIRVFWQNPSDSDFDSVRVVRSDRWYPGNESEGWVVYEGAGTAALDEDVALPGKKLFYSVFAYDREGNISAPTVASLHVSETGEPSVVLPPTESGTNTIGLNFGLFDFYQDELKLSEWHGGVTVDGARHLTIALPYDAVPEHLKTILIRIVPERDTTKELTFLLRVNKGKTAYTARLAPLGTNGRFTLFASVFDLETKQVGHTEGTIYVRLGSYGEIGNTIPEESTEGIWPQLEHWQRTLLLFLILLLLLVLILLGKRMFRRKTVTEPKHQLSNIPKR